MCKRWFKRFKGGYYEVNDHFKLKRLETNNCKQNPVEPLAAIPENISSLNQASIIKPTQWAKKHGKIILLHDDASSQDSELVKYTLKDVS